MNRSAPDRLAPPTKHKTCLINNPKQTRSNNNRSSQAGPGGGRDAQLHAAARGALGGGRVFGGRGGNPNHPVIKENKTTTR